MLYKRDKTNIYVFITCLIFLMNSCKEDLPNQFDDGIVLHLDQHLNSFGSSLELSILTNKVYPCANYSIVYTKQLLQNVLSISLDEVLVPVGCATTEDVANLKIPLNDLQEVNYKFELIVDGFVNSGELTITSDNYSLIFDKSENIDQINTTLNKIPENTIWGAIETQDENIANLFIDTLQILGATQKLYPSGEYGYFQISSENELTLFGSGYSQEHTEYFIFNYEEGFQALEQLMQHFRDISEESVRIVLYTYNGLIYSI